MMRAALLIALAALSAPALADEAEHPEPEVTRPVVSEIVTGSRLVQRGFTGVVAASSETDLAFTVQGQLLERRVATGAVVARGEVLALLDPVDLDTALRGAEAGVLQAEAQLAQARDAEERAVELASRGVGTVVQQEAAETERIAAEARLEQAIALRERAADQRNNATLLAPADGVVVSVMTEPGATLNPGQAVLRFAITAEREAVIDLTDAELASLDPDAPFTVSLLADPSVTTRAVLDSIAPVAARETRTREVQLTLEDPPEGFRLGALVVASPGGEAAALSLPMSAILAREDATHEAAVWVVARPEGRVSLASVTTGPEVGGRVAILSGLHEGQEVVIRGINTLAEGQVVGSRSAAP